MTIGVQMKPLRVAIIGAGPGGLRTAIALSKVPHVVVTIYEQASELSEVGAGINSGHSTWTVVNMNGRSGEELHRREKKKDQSKRPPIRTQRTTLQSALLAHVGPGTIQLSKKLIYIEDKGADGLILCFKDGSSTTADLIVGADGIRSVVRDLAWPAYEIKFTGTTIWRTLLPWDDVKDLDPRFATTGWWHSPTTHVFFSPVDKGLWEIAARAWHDPAVYSASKVSWGVPVDNAHVESHFTVMNTRSLLPRVHPVLDKLNTESNQEYLPTIRKALSRVPSGTWREFAAFVGPELEILTAWADKIVLIGDSSHALSGAFGSGAGFAMEDGWILAQALGHFKNDPNQALPLFNAIRLPYYSRMYNHIAMEAARRTKKLKEFECPSFDERVANKVINSGGADMSWIYENDIAATWEQAVEALSNR